MRRVFISLLVGILVTLFISQKQVEFPATAWWGTLYPKYCYSQIPSADNGEKTEIHIKFRWLHGL